MKKEADTLRKVICGLSMATVLALAGCASGKKDPAVTTEETKTVVEPITIAPTTLEQLTIAPTTEEATTEIKSTEAPTTEEKQDTSDSSESDNKIQLPLTDAAKQELKELLLRDAEEECIGITTAKGDETYGTPPRVMYITYTEVYSNVTEKYKVKAGKMEQVDPEEPQEESVRSGMYSSVGSISIKVDEKKGEVSLSYVYGPLYGAGYTYEIVEDEEGVHPGAGKMDWIS